MNSYDWSLALTLLIIGVFGVGTCSYSRWHAIDVGNCKDYVEILKLDVAKSVCDTEVGLKMVEDLWQIDVKRVKKISKKRKLKGLIKLEEKWKARE